MDKYDMLNERQREAVFCTEGPLLILAGAGSGKTRVLTHRIAYLIEEKGVAPYEIMAITFTNKAAGEMKERVTSMVEYGDAVWVMTFHSTCVRILRRYIERLGYDRDFTIYDADDQKTVVRKVVKELNYDPKMYRETALVKYISDCKTAMESPDDMRKAASELSEKRYAEIYGAYENRLRKNNALDFDDLLLKTVELFQTNPDVLAYYQRRFRYIMVDEYQDTNHVQFEFIYLLAKEHRNLAVVGDDDQSIYRFRGADIRNILDFEQSFPGTKVVKLEQNYRSTTHILDVANAVIRNNRGRKEKHLWSALGAGENVTLRTYDSGMQEAENVVRTVRDAVNRGTAHYKDFAVLYRTNVQSRLFEEKCVAMNVPYVLVGGVNFYQREEIKDILAYLKTVASGIDNVATERIINKPKRGIGDESVNSLLNYANQNGLSLMEAAAAVEHTPVKEGTAKKIRAFSDLIADLREKAGLKGEPENRMSFADLIREIVDATDYDAEVIQKADEDKQDQKRENIAEFISKAQSFEDNWQEENLPTLTDFLEEVALVADVDSLTDSDDKLILMTLHGSKGLEFPTVFLAGMEDGLFPSSQALYGDDTMALEEERRLAYVGITRAMRTLHLSCARMRMTRGEMQYNEMSRFLKEIPLDLIEVYGMTKKKADGLSGSTFSSFGYKPKQAGFGGGASFGKSVSELPSVPPKPVQMPGKPARLDYTVGDRVLHFKFGEGTVMNIEDTARDYQVTVNFDGAGEKCLFAGFAKLQKI